MTDDLHHHESADEGASKPQCGPIPARAGTPIQHESRGLRVTFGEESIFAHGHLVGSTVERLLGAISEYSDRGLLEVVIDLTEVTDLDYEAIAALSAAQQRAGSAGRVLRVRTSNRSMQVALAGCHIDPDQLADVKKSDEQSPRLEVGYRAWSKDS